MIFHRAEPQTRLAGWAFISLALLFLSIGNTNRVVSFSGLGATMVLGAILVEANKERIWKEYKKNYKYRKADLLPRAWTEPNRLYYNLNVYVVWPALFVTGLVSIWVAYAIS